MTEVCGELGESCQGMILVYEHGNPESFEALQPWAAFVEEFRPGVLLCVANERPLTPQPRPAQQRAAAADAKSREALVAELESVVREWCLDKGLEHVSLTHKDSEPAPVDAKSDAVDESDEADGILGGREAVGVARLSEALHANIWDHMQRKEPPRREGRAHLPPRRNDSDFDDAVHAALAAGASYAPPLVPEAAPAAAEASAAREPAPRPAARQPGAGQNPFFDQLAAQADEERDDDDQMMMLLEQMRRVRAEAADLPDDVRRARAEEMMLRLLRFVQAGEEEQGDESESAAAAAAAAAAERGDS